MKSYYNSAWKANRRAWVLGKHAQFCSEQWRATCICCIQGIKRHWAYRLLFLSLFNTVLASLHFQCLCFLLKLALKSRVTVWKHKRFASQPIDRDSQHRSAQGLQIEWSFVCQACLFPASLVWRNCTCVSLPSLCNSSRGAKSSDRLVIHLSLLCVSITRW